MFVQDAGEARRSGRDVAAGLRVVVVGDAARRRSETWRNRSCVFYSGARRRGGVLVMMRDRSVKPIAPRMPAMAGRSTSQFHLPGRYYMHQARSDGGEVGSASSLRFLVGDRASGGGGSASSQLVFFFVAVCRGRFITRVSSRLMYGRCGCEMARLRSKGVL